MARQALGRGLDALLDPTREPPMTPPARQPAKPASRVAIVRWCGDQCVLLVAGIIVAEVPRQDPDAVRTLLRRAGRINERLSP